LILQGKRWFNSVTGEYFPIKGMAYYPRPNTGELSQSASVDFYTADYEERWSQDIDYFEQLGINALRIYAVAPDQDHTGFMCALQEKGIYVMIGLMADCLNCGIGATSQDDSPPDCYSSTLKERGQFIIRTFSRYDNVLAFSAGNEATIYAQDRQSNVPCQKKFIRDMRHYVNACGPTANAPAVARSVPIGVVGWDNDDVTPPQTEYYACQTGDDPLESTEWYGINTYRHCDASAQSVDDLDGYERLRNLFIDHNLPIPIVLAEYGCRAENFPTGTIVDENGVTQEFDAQRTWLQIDMLYSTPDYLDVFAGGVAYEFSAEKLWADRSLEGHPWPYYGYMQLNYGVGYLYPLDCDNIDIMCQFQPYPEFLTFADKMAAVDTSFVPNMNEPSGQVAGAIPECPAQYPPLSDFVWATDDDDEAILACSAGGSVTTPSPTTSEPQETEAPTAASTEEDTEASTPVGTEGITNPPVADDTPRPTAEDASTSAPTVTPQPPLVQEMCSDNPSCAAQDGIFSAGIESCCPARDDATLFLDCCAAIESFCTDANGDLIVCRTVSTSQYVGEVVTGQRDPSGSIATVTFPPTTNGSNSSVRSGIRICYGVVAVIAAMIMVG
jgi:hypothetical protein